MNYENIEKKIMNTIFNQFHLYNIDKKLWQTIDNDMLENELKVMLKGHQQDTTKTLYSTPCFQEKYYKEVEQEFLNLAYHLMNKVG